jgi:putative membrane protein
MRVASFIGGLTILASVWLGPLVRLAPASFSAHMTMHMAIVAAAAPLLALGLAGGRFDPVTRAPGLFTAVPASIVELVVVWAWHAPGPHHFARGSGVGLAIEQASFLASGLWVWLAAFGGDHDRDPARTGAGLVALLLTSMHMTLLGALLALPPRPLYGHLHHGGGSALDDQHVGGAIMLIAGGVVYLVGGLWLGARLLRRGAAQPRRIGRS